MTLALEARNLSLERFFGDIRLPGTGLSGGATLSIALRWGEGGLEARRRRRDARDQAGPGDVAGARALRHPDRRRRHAQHRGRADRLRRNDLPLPGVLAGVDRRAPDRPVDAGFRLPPSLPRSRRSRPAVPELHGRERRPAGAPGPRGQRRGRRPHRKIVGEPRRHRPDFGGERELRRRPLRQRAGHDRDGGRRLPLPSAAGLRGQRDALARRHGAVPPRPGAAHAGRHGGGQGLSRRAAARLSRSRVSDRRAGDGDLPAPWKPARLGLGIRER